MFVLDLGKTFMNKKRILTIVFIIIILGLLGYSAKIFLLEKNKFNLFGKSVKGISTQKQENASNILQQKLADIQQQVSKLNIADIASTSAQVQKLINDLNALKDYPANQAKEICQNICNSL